MYYEAIRPPIPPFECKKIKVRLILYTPYIFWIIRHKVIFWENNFLG